jgi:hypothetical protein
MWLMTATNIPDSWWPDFLRPVSEEDPLATDPVVVAMVDDTPNAHEHYRHLFTAFVPPDQLQASLEHPGGIGWEVSTSGPHPAGSPGDWGYRPKFWVYGTAEEGLEPLVVSWQTGDHLVMLPDQGFLMTYGLVPRVDSNELTQTVHWDDPATPKYDIVVCRSTSVYDFPRYNGAKVAIARDFLQDYATIRGRALIQVYYLQETGPLTDEISDLLGDEDIRELRLRGRRVEVRRIPSRRDEVLVQVWGARPLVVPGAAPVTLGRWDYGSLEWPGISGAVDLERALGLGLEEAFVSDGVLAEYEGAPGFTTDPESGGVSRGHQWSVAWSRRVGRDLIAVQLKKLYEGTPPGVVFHWHEHATSPPSSQASTSNVGTRTRRIAYALVALGEGLAKVARAAGLGYTGAELVSLDRSELDYYGWWTNKDAERVGRHVPQGISEDEFLHRCAELHKLVVEGLSEGRLRVLAVSLGAPGEEIQEFRSLRLLQHIAKLGMLADGTGLSLTNGGILHARILEVTEDPVAGLHGLNELRQLADHKAGSSRNQRLDSALALLGIDQKAYIGQLGLALDKVYDRVAETLEDASAILAATPIPP